jgi:histidinol-phosphate aminotransferase
MSKYWNTRTQNLEPYTPGEQPGPGERFIKLNTNENPYPPSPAVLEAIQEVLAVRADPGSKVRGGRLALYPDPGCTALREAIARRYQVKPGQVFCGNGSDEVLAFAFGAFFEPEENSPTNPTDDAVLLPDVSYSFYPVFAKLWNVPIQKIALQQDWSLVPADYCRPNRGVVIANPNAPTAMALKAAEFEALLDYQKRQGRLLLIDEAYCPFADEGASLVPRINDYDNLLTVHTLSKAWALAGMRVGFAIGNEALIEGLCRIRDSFNSYTLDALAQAAAAAALDNASWYEIVKNKIRTTRARTRKALIEHGCTVLPSQANFIFVRHPEMGGADFAAALRKNGVLVRHFTGPRVEDFVRVSIGTDADMDKFLECVYACH